MHFLSYEKVRDLFAYEPLTGRLLWKQPRPGRPRPGSEAGTAQRYRTVRVDGVAFPAHSIAWCWMTGEWPIEVDHKNGKGTDNRWSNLRDISHRHNGENRRRANENSTSGILGVNPKRGKFRARLWVDGKDIHLGTFRTAEEAQAAHLAAKRQLHAGNTL